MRKNKVHSPEFKIKVVEDIMSGAATVNGSAEKYGINRSIIQSWLRHYRKDGVPCFLEEHRGRHMKQKTSDVDYESMSDKEKIHYLEMENAILKKAKALGLIK